MKLEKKLMKSFQRVIVSGNRFTALVPRQRFTRSMTGLVSIGAIELNRCKTCILAELLGDDLIRRYAVGHILSGDRITVCPGQPKGTAPMGLIGVVVGTSLYDGKILLVPGQWAKALGQLVLCTRVFLVGIPSLPGHSEADPHEDRPFGDGNRCFRGRGCKTAETYGFEGG